MCRNPTPTRQRAIPLFGSERQAGTEVCSQVQHYPGKPYEASLSTYGDEKTAMSSCLLTVEDLLNRCRQEMVATSFRMSSLDQVRTELLSRFRNSRFTVEVLQRRCFAICGTESPCCFKDDDLIRFRI